MLLDDKKYSVLKWLVTVVLPAFIVFLGTILSVLNVANAEVYITILGALELFLGSIFKFSEYKYDKEKEKRGMGPHG